MGQICFSVIKTTSLFSFLWDNWFRSSILCCSLDNLPKIKFLFIDILSVSFLSLSLSNGKFWIQSSDLGVSRSIKYFSFKKLFTHFERCVWKSQPWHVPLILRIIAWDYQRSLCALKFFFNFSFVRCTGCLYAVARNLPTWVGLLCCWLDGWQSDTCLQNNAIDQDVMSCVGCTYFNVAFAHMYLWKKKPDRLDLLLETWGKECTFELLLQNCTCLLTLT